METLLLFLERHMIWFVALIAAVIILEVLVRLFHTKQKEQDGKKVNNSNGATFWEEFSKNAPETVIMIRLEDRRTVYVSDNIEKNLHIKKGQVYTDIRALERITTRHYIRKANSAYEQWDRSDSLKMEYSYAAENKDDQWGRAVISLTEDGQYLMIILNDITEEYQKREEQERKIEEAKQVDQSKTEFLSKMSHEIRTPMNGMLGMISLAKMSIEKPQEAEDYLDKAESLSKFLLSIINDILDMSRIESGKIELEQVRFDLVAMAEKLRSMFQITIEDKGIHFAMEMQDFTIRYVVGDELRITQVITNFLSNAQKFTEKDGSITVTFRQMQIIDGKVELMIRVRDTGKGIAPEFIHRIFKPFEQEDAGIVRRYGGSGLGMAISDNLVQLMGGQIVVDSKLGAGSDFTIYLGLPIAEGSQEAEEVKEIVEETPDEVVTLEGCRYLLAEDNAINAVIMVKLLGSQGALVDVAVNGLEAVQKFQESEPGTYKAILMDIQMPELSGWDAAARIRAMERLDARKIPIFALSADAFTEDKRHSLEVGMNGHISKPVDFNELQKILLENL